MPLPDFNLHADHVDRVYVRYWGELKKFFERRLRKKGDRAEDFVQSVYECLMEAETQALEKVREPESYVFKIAWNVLCELNRLRAHEPRDHLGIDSIEFEKSLEGEADLLMGDANQEIDGELLRRALGELSLDVQRVVKLDYEGYTCKEISDATHINICTVRKYLRKGWAHLRERYGTSPTKSSATQSKGQPHEDASDD